MLKKVLILLFAFVITIPLATAAFAQEAAAQAKEEARWEGTIVISDQEHSTLTVRKVGSTEERTIKYGSSTKWVSQYHGDKKINKIDASQVKDGDRVICTGSWEKAGVLRATQISKRLSHSPQ
jgi:biopolymer transport protein ExbD